MSYWGMDVRARFKDDKSVVTEADLRVNEFIRNEFPKRFPDYGLLTEESEDSSDRLSKSCIFILDELDGSSDFKRKESDFCFLCAYSERGSPLMGVVYEPLKKRMFFAQRGKGAYVTQDGNTRELERLRPTEWNKSIVGHPTNYKGDKYSKLYELMGIPEERLKRSGSMGTRMMQVRVLPNSFARPRRLTQPTTHLNMGSSCPCLTATVTWSAGRLRFTCPSSSSHTQHHQRECLCQAPPVKSTHTSRSSGLKSMMPPWKVCTTP